MEKKKLLELVKVFIGPMVIGAIIAYVNIGLVQNGTMEDITIIRIVYTFSDNFIGFLKWFAPFMSLVLIATGMREIRGEVASFLTRFTFVLITSLLAIGIISIVVSMLIVPLFVVDFSFTDSLWPDVYFTIPFFKHIDVFTALIVGIGVGIIAQYSSFINKLLDKSEVIINFVVKHIIMKLSPLWIIGSFAGSIYSMQGLSIVWFDIWLSLIVTVIQVLWLCGMYFILSKYSKISFKQIYNAGVRIFVIVLAMNGMTNSAIYPYLLDEQRDLGLNPDKAKFVTVSSFNMPGSLISHIVFVYGLALLFGLPITFVSLTKYMVVLTFVLVVSPAISGGVFTMTSTLLAPMLGFTDPMIALMSSMYFKQGRYNAAVNNCADFYLTGLSMRRAEFECCNPKHEQLEVSI